MSALVAFAVVAILVGLGVLHHRRPTAGHEGVARRLPTDLGLTTDDARDLEDAARRLEEEFGCAPVQVLLYRLGSVVRRNVPIRAVRPGPVRGLARLCFADGTVFQIRGQHAGDLGTLAAHSLSRPVRLTSYHQEQATVLMDLGWSEKGRVTVMAVGLDQAD